jgi:predicted DNA-binding protein YlxM (UPF0122 family)
MTPPPAIARDKLNIVKDLYLNKKYCVREVAETLGVSTDAVEYFIRKNNIPKRSYKESQQAKFERKPCSFTKRKLNSSSLREIAVIGTMLYWAEGYKGNDKLPASGVDFANSDHRMIALFLKFLRSVFILDEKRFRGHVYCYANQDSSKIIDFWAHLTGIPRSQFTKPYVRTDFNDKSNKMLHGLVHIRYGDKKLLLEIKSMIQSYVTKYA